MRLFFLTVFCSLLSFLHKVMLSVNRDNFIFSFSIWMLFIVFSCLIALAWTSSTMLIRTSNSRPSCFVPDLEVKLSIFTIEYEFSCVLFINGLYYVDIVSFYSWFIECVFFSSWNGIEFCHTFFLHQLSWSCYFSPFC